MTSRRDYEAVAQILGETEAPYATGARIADYFAATNPRFDKERFLVAVKEANANVRL